MDLYYIPESPPCRGVLLVGAALGIDFNLIRVSMKNGEHMTPEYLQMNPQHTVPTFVDGELILCESKAIGQYLADQYGTDDSLYPKDPTERALVNQRLFFDVTLFSTIPNFYYPMIFANQPESPQMHSTIDKNFQFFDTFLDGQDYAALGHLTIADLFLITTVSTLEIAGNEIEKYPNVNRWYQNLLTTMPGIETHLAGVEATKGLFGRKEKEEEA